MVCVRYVIVNTVHTGDNKDDDDEDVDEDNNNNNNNNNNTLFTGEITLRVTQSVNTEQLQHYVHCKYGLFQVHNFIYRA
jgi:hypothetical protein